MSRTRSTVAEFLPGDTSKRPTVEQRIKRRYEVLRDWLRNGIPDGKGAPKDLKAARTWNDPELGIMSIASPNEFTTTHPVHGKLVRDIAEILSRLKRSSTLPVSSLSRVSQDSFNRLDHKASNRQLEAAVSQWQSERDRRLHEKNRADAADARSVMLLDEIANMEKLIADLRRRLAGHDGLRPVK